MKIMSPTFLKQTSITSISVRDCVRQVRLHGVQQLNSSLVLRIRRVFAFVVLRLISSFFAVQVVDVSAVRSRLRLAVRGGR